MPPSSDDFAGQNKHRSNVGRYYQQKNPSNDQIGARSRDRNIRRHELGRENSKGADITRIYPREITNSPPSLLPSLYQAPASPTNPASRNTSTSPLLAALGSAAIPTANSTEYHTSEWTKSLPSFTVPPNGPTKGVSINGSPPILPSSYGEGATAYKNATPSVSPPTGRPRPLSHPSNYQSFGHRLQQSPEGNRRTSMASHKSKVPAFMMQQPLPHQAQAHFYGVPNADLGLPSEGIEGLLPGEGSYFCGFDHLPASGYEISGNAENFLLVGSEGKLDIFNVERDKLDIIGRLEGLRGGVVKAKLLPWTFRDDPYASYRPLVALVIHGPVLPPSTNAGERPISSHSECIVSEEVDGIETSPLESAVGTNHDTHLLQFAHYQTTVEVYSLSASAHITTLFTSAKVAITCPLTSPLFSPPQPVGNLSLQANGKFITVASGISGEVFIYGVDVARHDVREAFRCLGKVWTAVQVNNGRSVSSSSSSTDADSGNGDEIPAKPQGSVALHSLSHRWLAVVPPPPSSTFSLNGVARLLASQSKPPGISSHVAPSQPPITCVVDTPEGESLFNRMAREVTQELIKGARWVGDQGMQAWRNYWNKPSPAVGSSGGFSGISQMRDQQYNQAFPPTHAHANQTIVSKSEPALISLLDLEKIAKSQDMKGTAAIVPLATFPAPYGCSFVSFAPNGLALLSASKNGDTQFVWDLLRVGHGKAGGPLASELEKLSNPNNSAPQGPHVRQIARFTRMTVASIVDVTWASPRGEKLAIVTEKGTVHLFELPSSTFQWPPPRRLSRLSNNTQSQTTDGAREGVDVDGGNAGNAVSAAMNMMNGKTQPLLAAVRSRRPSVGANFSGIGGLGWTSAASAKGGKAMISKSLGAATGTVNSFRNLGEDRLHLPGNPEKIDPLCVTWLNGKDRGFIAVVGGGLLRIHSTGQKSRRKGGDKRPCSSAKDKGVEFPLPHIANDILAPSILEHDAGRAGDSEETTRLNGYWTPRSHINGVDDGSKARPHPLSHAEIETNPPYQPFHTDRRITLFVYNDPPATNEWDPPSESCHIEDASPWVFGDDIPVTKLSLGMSAADDPARNNPAEEEMVGMMENSMNVRDRDDEVEQVVITTRRRKSRIGVQEDGFFEDDCEVLDFAENRV
ncbi:MAG: hypothetical protein M1827_000971 [Pycnora praestabilis]|nr:MAG: hypothetical protein M1827_000971 [Pycnora praestabilis]